MNSGALTPNIPDLAMLFIVVLVLAVFAVRYSTKGIGDRPLLQVEEAATKTEAFSKNPHHPFFAVIIRAPKIDVCEIVNHKKQRLQSFSTLEKFAASINKNESYVIYEENKSALLGEVVRALVRAHVATIQIARIGD